MHDFPTLSPSHRWQAVDLARGAAVVAMIAYHLAWDLSLYRLIPVEVAFHPVGRTAARLIAGSFLVLVGVGLVLAHGRALRARPFLKRLALVGGAALAVTAATAVTFPQSYIFFGILHAVALFSVLALPALRAPLWLAFLVALLCFAAPLVLTQGIFDAPLLAFLGLGTRVPLTNDYVPVFPWFGVVLLGVAATRAALRSSPAERWAAWRSAARPARGLAWMGRHSLAIYLLHQPLLLGALYPVAQALGPHPGAEAAAFRGTCARGCTEVVRDAEGCRAACACVEREMRAGDLWTPALSGRLSAEQRALVSGLRRRCFVGLRPSTATPPSP